MIEAGFIVGWATVSIETALSRFSRVSCLCEAISCFNLTRRRAFLQIRSLPDDSADLVWRWVGGC